MSTELDRAMIDQIRELDDDDGSLLRDIVDTFLDDAPKRIASIHAAQAAGNNDELHRAAHTLKGAASNLGLLQLVEAATRLVLAVREGQTEAVPELIEAVDAAWPRAEELLRAEVD